MSGNSDLEMSVNIASLRKEWVDNNGEKAASHATLGKHQLAAELYDTYPKEKAGEMKVKEGKLGRKKEKKGLSTGRLIFIWIIGTY
jgi:hypothetical protein